MPSCDHSRVSRSALSKQRLPRLLPLIQLRLSLLLHRLLLHLYLFQLPLFPLQHPPQLPLYRPPLLLLLLPL